MICKICGNNANPIYKGRILNKYDIQYFYCDNCGFMQTEEPYWLEEAYSEAISISDTGVMARNISFAETAGILFNILCDRNQKFLDYGGGYGIFTRLMRDKGFDFYWYDKYAKNLVARGFEGKIEDSIYSAVTSFENFEHFYDPMGDIETIFNLTDIVLFSTDLLPNPVPSPSEWWYYCLEHGQHISFFSLKSLEFIAKQYGYFFISNGTNLHVLSKKKISPKIFLLTKMIRKFRMSRIFYNHSKTFSDMNDIILKMSKTNKR